MNQQYNQEIDLFQLGIEILKKWRVVLAMVLLFGVIIGGGITVIGLRKLQNTEYMKAQTEAVNEAQNKYEKLKALYETQLENIEKELASKEAYRDSSIYMNLDPYNVYKETVSYYISTDYQIMPGMDFQNINPSIGIIRAYGLCINDEAIYQKVIAERKYDVTISDLRELVNYTAENDKNLFIITVMGQDKEMAQAIMDAIQEKIAGSRDQISEAIQEHTIQESGKVGGYAVDMTLLDTLSKHNDTITKLQEMQTKKQKELNELVKPSGSVPTKATVMKNTVKYGVLGCFLGGIIACMWICSLYIVKDLLPDAVTLRRVYGVRVIGTYREKGTRRPFSFIDKLVEKLESGTPSEYDLDQAYAIAAANIAAAAEKDTKVLLIGNLDVQQMHRSYDRIRKNLEGTCCILMEGGDILENPDTITVLPQTDAVVLIEDMRRTSNARFAKEIDAVRAAGKKLVGLIEVYIG